MTKAFRFFAPYSLAYALTFLSLLGFYFGGAGFYSALLVFFILHPLLDNFIFPGLRILPLPTLETNAQPARAADVFLLLALPTLTGILAWSCMISSALKPGERLGLILSCGVISGVLGINIAHELVHRRQKWQRACGVYLLMTCNFAHWGIAHVVGHHKNVATPLDSATAHFNESVYHFWLREYVGGWREVIHIESRKSFFRRRPLWYLLISLFASGLIATLIGPMALLFWWGQSIVAILLLQTVDYIEHYGLTREKNPETGLYEAFKPPHSWDTSRAMTNYVLVNLGFHSHHHLKTVLPYPELREQEKARQMPYGYSLMALLALMPPLYFKLVNPLLASIHSKSS